MVTFSQLARTAGSFHFSSSSEAAISFGSSLQLHSLSRRYARSVQLVRSRTFSCISPLRVSHSFFAILFLSLCVCVYVARGACWACLKVSCARNVCESPALFNTPGGFYPDRLFCSHAVSIPLITSLLPRTIQKA